MKKRYMLSISLVVVALAALAVLTQPAAPAKAGPGLMPQRQAEDEIIAQQEDYLSIAGCTFVPDDSGTEFYYRGGGGVSVQGGSRFMHAPVILPQGAEILGIRFYWYDNNDGELMEAALYRNNGDGTRDQLIQVDSPTGVLPGNHYGSDYEALSTSEMVDNSLYNYEIEVYWSSATVLNDLRFMRVRVQYVHP